MSEAGRGMLAAAKSVAIEIEKYAENMSELEEPKYHNRLHFADALTSMSILLAILTELEKEASHDWMVCALHTSASTGGSRMMTPSTTLLFAVSGHSPCRGGVRETQKTSRYNSSVACLCYGPCRASGWG